MTISRLFTIILATMFALSACGLSDPPAYTGVIEKVSPGGKIIELIVEDAPGEPCVGVRDKDSGDEATTCGPLDLRTDLALNGESFAVARVVNRIDEGAASLGDCIRSDEATLADGSYVYWCLRGVE